MKRYYYFIVLLMPIIGCKDCKRESSSVQISTHISTLDQFISDTTKLLDTALINNSFAKLILPNISMSPLFVRQDDVQWDRLLKSELKLLNNWNSVENYKVHSNINIDSLLIFRCSAFDRAPYEAQRVSSSIGMRALSYEYYIIEVPVAFHIITNQKGDGLFPNMESIIHNQFLVINEVYNKFNISFKLLSIDTTVNDSWFYNASYYRNKEDLVEMTSLLSINPSEVMNVFCLNPGVLGEAPYPWYSSLKTSMDYVIINFNTLPGSPNIYKEIFNQGETLVHEVGHFLGLIHTFEGGADNCKSPNNDGCSIGDLVDDTPSQKICLDTGCIETSDSCPQPGYDPVKNYMGYNPDSCMSEMTPGQGERLIQCILKYRYYLVTNPI